jgi:hypothetical protein
MKILMIDSFNRSIEKEVDFIPRIGDKIDCFGYMPIPKVTDVIFWPDKEKLSLSNNYTALLIIG